MGPLVAYSDPAGLAVSEAGRIAQLLAIESDRDMDDVALARRIEAGLSPDSISPLAAVLGSEQVIGPVVPEATLRRARKSHKPLSREHSERLYELSRVIDALGRIYHGDVPSMNAFLARPHPLLDGATPLEMARSSSAGAEAVLNLIRRIEYGFPV